MRRHRFISTTLVAAVLATVGSVGTLAVAGNLPGVASASASASASSDTTDAAGAARVSREDYEAAVASYRECGEAAGLVAEVAPGEGLRVTRVSFQIPVGDDEDPDVALQTGHAALTACRSQHLDNVEIAWIRQLDEPSEAEVIELYDWLEACIADDRPVSGPVAWWGTVYRTAPQDRVVRVEPGDWFRYRQCAAEAEALTGLQAPPAGGRPAGLPRP